MIGGAGGALGGWVGAAAGAAVSVGGFIGGATAGGAAGAVTGFVNGFGMSMLNNPRDVGGAFWQGVYQSAIGGLGGAAVGGLVQGSISAINGNNFWNGRSPIKFNSERPYIFDPDPEGANTTLYRGTSGHEFNVNDPLFMTDNIEYAASYVKNGGKLISVEIPNNTLELMLVRGDLEMLKGINAAFNNIYYIEYRFSSNVKFEIIKRFKW